MDKASYNGEYGKRNQKKSIYFDLTKSNNS